MKRRRLDRTYNRKIIQGDVHRYCFFAVFKNHISTQDCGFFIYLEMCVCELKYFNQCLLVFTFLNKNKIGEKKTTFDDDIGSQNIVENILRTKFTTKLSLKSNSNKKPN